MDQPLLRFSVALPLLLACVSAPAFAEDAPAIDGGKLLLTNGVSTIEGTSGGGLATWATIAGRETDRGIGLSGHVTLIELPDYGWQSHGVSVAIANRVELSYARQNFDTRDVGTALGLGEGYTLNQDVFGAKLRVVGDVVYGDPLLPQISVGVEHRYTLRLTKVAARCTASATGSPSPSASPG